MIDPTPSAASMPAQPVTAVTSPEGLPPPPVALPCAVGPAVTGPVSNLDFLPVDDAFALELRAESIEQLIGRDSLRRGVSERIEAGRSKANADLVAGRDRVHVRGALREHTGHGLAEQVAHLHTTVEGALDVHAGGDDTVLLAGHMTDAWDGGAAIVAAMSDDTVGGGGVRVTTPLDAWLHAVMGVEERIGTCIADAVLMELAGTHYEREYGPGVHAAGVAAYTGSLYQSSRSTFWPLMKVSSGVRNLIAGGGGGDGGGSGGAGSAPGASPPPVPAQTGAAAEAVTGTLAAGRRAAEAPATALDAADGLTGARRVPLDELVHTIDVRVAEDIGAAGAVMRAEDLPELTRSADTAERLGALRETLRMDGADTVSEATDALRASEVEGAVSVHPARGAGGALEIDPPSAVYGDQAPMVPARPAVPSGQEPEIKLGLLGGADRPPQPAVPETDFPAVNRRMRNLRSRYPSITSPAIFSDLDRAISRNSAYIMYNFKGFGGKEEQLVQRPRYTTLAEQAYRALQTMAARVELEGDSKKARAIRGFLLRLDKRAVEALQTLIKEHKIATDPSTPAMQPPPAGVGPTTSAALSVTTTPPVTVPSMTAPLAGRLDVPGPAHRIVPDVNPAFFDPSGGLVHLPGVPGPPPASSLPGPSLSVAAGAETAGPGRWRLHPPATTTPGTTAAQPTAIETIVTPALGEASSFWLQPFDPVPAPGTVPFETGVHHAAVAVQPPPLTSAPGAAHQIPSHSPSWLDDFAVERALIAEQLPPGFDASQLIIEAGAFVEFSIADNLEAGLLPTGTIDALLEGYEASDVGGSNLLYIEYLHMLKQNIERALRDAYPGRTDPQWLEKVREFLRWREEIAAASAASATGLPELAAAEIDQLLGTAEGVSHLTPPPATFDPRSAPTGLPELGAAEIDQLLGTAEGASYSAPPPAAFDPWSTSPGPSSRVMPTPTIRAPVMSTGAPPGWQAAETPGFGRAATDSGPLPFSHREAIVLRFRTDDALLDAEYSLQTGGASALEWSAKQVREVLADLFVLSNIARLDPDDAAAMENIDWNAMYALMQILDVPPPSP